MCPVLPRGVKLTIDGNAEGIPEKIDAPPALPKAFAFTFSMPYGLGDEFPREPKDEEVVDPA